MRAFSACSEISWLFSVWTGIIGWFDMAFHFPTSYSSNSYNGEHNCYWRQVSNEFRTFFSNHETTYLSDCHFGFLAASESDVMKAIEVIYPIIKEFRCALRLRDPIATKISRKRKERVVGNFGKRPRAVQVIFLYSPQFLLKKFLHTWVSPLQPLTTFVTAWFLLTSPCIPTVFS